MSQFTTSDDGEQGAVAAKAETAAHEASGVTHTATEAARGVAETGAHEAAAVASEAKDRFGDLITQGGRELSDQAAGQQQRLAAGLGTIGDDLSRMAAADEGGGLAAGLVRRVAEQASTVGTWLGDRDPQQLLHEITSFARRRPGTFIAVAAVAGVVVGRLSRAIAAGGSVGSGGSAASGAPAPRFADADAANRRADDEAGTDATGSPAATATTDTFDPPVFAESAARSGIAPEGAADERPGTV